MQIAFIGGCDVDQFYILENGYPEIGSKAFVSDGGVKAGGMVANACMIAAGIGIQAKMFHELSRASLSTPIILDELKTMGVDTRYITLSERSNKQCFIFQTEGERVIFVLKSDKDEKIRLSQTQQEKIMNADAIYTTISDLQAFADIDTLCKRWHQSGKKLFIDCDANILKDELPFLEYAAAISINIFGLKQIEAMGFSAQSLRETYKIPLLIITKGAGGSELYTKTKIFHQKALLTPVIDTTGAGDTFNICFFYAFLQGFSEKQCLLFATSAAAQAVSQKGAHATIDLTKISL